MSDLAPWLRGLLAERLSVAADAIESEARLNRYGLTSLTAASIVKAIEEHTRRRLPPTLVWDYPTLERLTAFLEGRPDADAHVPIEPIAADDTIAIVGMGCRFPGGANDACCYQPQISPKWISEDGKSFWMVWTDFRAIDGDFPYYAFNCQKVNLLVDE